MFRNFLFTHFWHWCNLFSKRGRKSAKRLMIMEKIHICQLDHRSTSLKISIGGMCEIYYSILTVPGFSDERHEKNGMASTLRITFRRKNVRSSAMFHRGRERKNNQKKRMARCAEGTKRNSIVIARSKQKKKIHQVRYSPLRRKRSHWDTMFAVEVMVPEMVTSWTEELSAKLQRSRA